MYQKIKTLAESAIALQNKGAMDAALREIGALAELGAAKKSTEEVDLSPAAQALYQAEGASRFKEMEESVRRQMADAQLLKSAPTGFVAKAREGESKFEPAEFPFAREETATAAIALTEASLTDALAGMLSDVGAGTSVPAAFDQNFDPLMGAPKIGSSAVDEALTGPSAKQAAHLIDIALSAQTRIDKKGAK